MASSVLQAANGPTNARSAQSCMQGACAHIGTTQTTNRTQTTDCLLQDLEIKFNPLPLSIISPINVEVLDKFLENYPCQSTRDYLVSGFRYGFDIGFRGTFDDPNARPRNLLSARNNVEQVTEAIAKELSRGHTSGPFPYPLFRTLIAHPSGQPQNLTALSGLFWIYHPPGASQ